MATAAELVLAEQLGHLREIIDDKQWDLVPAFILDMPARDNSCFWLLVECDRFPAIPPAWHWFNPATKAVDHPGDTPRGGGFFHSSGRICAPWNRLAYKSIDPKGPHSDWDLANWMSNPNTRACTTLAAMAMRIYVELQGPYEGRLG